MTKRVTKKIGRDTRSGKFVTVESAKRGNSKHYTIERVSASGKRTKETHRVSSKSAKIIKGTSIKRKGILKRLAKK